MHTGGFIGAAALALTVAVSSPAALPASAGVVAQRADVPAVGAKEAYVVDSDGTVHFSKRETKRVPVASLTKVMTAYVVLHSAKLTDTVTISAGDVKHAVSQGATTAGLKKGERLTVRDLLYGLLLPSGADAASALARTYGPGLKAFVGKMNTSAKRLGLADTRYSNPDGLPAPAGGYSTAADQVALTRKLMADPTFKAVVGTGTHKVAKSGSHRAHTWRNSNKLLAQADGVLGVKTGYTNAAGYCLLFAAERGGKQVVGVLLGDTDSRRFSTAVKLLDYVDAQLSGL